MDPDTIFDRQVKRIHEYKRQLVHALRIVVLCDRLRENPTLEMTPRTFLFAGKAAAYHLAKLIIKLLNGLAATIDADPSVRARLKVVFLREYCAGVKTLAAGWKYDAVSIGYPGPVLHGRPVAEPRLLGPGWAGFDYRTAFGCPVKLVNDAAMT